MSQEINSYCDICGRGYHICNSCKEITSFTPWRTVTDTIDHYKIFLVLSNYTKTKDKNKAKEKLGTCNLSDLESFRKEIKSVIEEIMSEEKVNDETIESETKKVKEDSVENKTVKKTVRKATVKAEISDVKIDEVKNDIE